MSWRKILQSKMKDKYLKLYSSCKSVRGKERGAFYILDENRIEIVPLSMIELTDSLKQYSIEECKKIVNSEILFNEYIDYLIVKRIGFVTDEPNSFSDMDDFYDSPSHIFISCISIDEKSTYDLINFVKELDDLLCKHIEIRLLYSPLCIEQLLKILKLFEKTTIRSIDLHISNCPFFLLPKLMKILDSYKKISHTVLYSMPYEKIESGVIFTTQHYNDIGYSPFNEKILYINIKHYSEAQHFNPFYNKKISIDKNGFIRNNLICKIDYGLYCSITNPISEIIKNKEFTKYWKINSDMIEDVRDSELRYAIFLTYEIDEINGKYYFKKD